MLKPLDMMSFKDPGVSFFSRLFRHDSWNIGIIDEPIHRVAALGIEGRVRWLPAPQNGTFLADPFGVISNDHLVIVCEQFDYRTGKGRLHCIQFMKDGTLTHVNSEMPCRCHLSYPYLIQHAGEIYCIPETSAAQEIALYKAVDFPVRWTKVSTLIEGVNGIDPTVIHFDGLWWMWWTDASWGSNTNLFLWFANKLTGPWQPHPANPVKSNSRSSRPAGTPYIHDSDLYRPAQNCSRRYGGEIVINKVLSLKPEEYLEQEVAVLSPDHGSRYRHGLHTLSAVGNRTLVDGNCACFLREGLMLRLRRGSQKIRRVVKGRSNSQ